MAARRAAASWRAAGLMMLVVLGAAAAAEGGDGGGDGAALMAFKAGFSNAANALADWDGGSGTDHCAWRGVACDNASFAVLSLNLSNLNLGGRSRRR